jgi:nicotinate-nucleotide adenylyltransferase
VRLGILGGTFNPPHVGHLICAGEAHDQLGLDRVVLVPAGIPPHKPIDDPGAVHRTAMCRLATAADDRLAVDDLELHRPGPSFTLATLRALHERSPADELTLIVGADQAAALSTWREPERIVQAARLAVAARTGRTPDEVHDGLAAVTGATERSTSFHMPRIDISSTDVRARVAAGRSIRHLVPERVADYIAEHGLYAAAEVTA